VDVILIAAITQDGFIAHNSNEVISWSKDLALFKTQTMGYPVIMGSNTYGVIENELKGRDIIIFHRDKKPINILNSLSSDKCFIAGGGKTNAYFAPYLSHMFLTPHPIIFGKGIKLFDGKIKEKNLFLENTVTVNAKENIVQFQYKIIN
jgi:dihydrofolate reductase